MDKNFIFEWSTRYLEYICLLYKHQWNTKSAWFQRREYVTITTAISSRVKITFYLHVWTYEVFAGKLTWYFTGVYIIKKNTFCRSQWRRNWKAGLQFRTKKHEKIHKIYGNDQRVFALRNYSEGYKMNKPLSGLLVYWRIMPSAKRLSEKWTVGREAKLRVQLWNFKGSIHKIQE